MSYKVLIVEDQSDIRRLIRWSLEDGNYQMHEAADGEAGLALARDIHPDAILLDVMMPGAMDGLQMCAAVKQDPNLAQAQVIMLTARASPQDHEAARAAGADYFLPKPFSPIRLAELLSALLHARAGRA